MSAAAARGLTPSSWEPEAEHLGGGELNFTGPGYTTGASHSSAPAWPGKPWAFPRGGGSLGSRSKTAPSSPDLYRELTFKQLGAQPPPPPQ